MIGREREKELFAEPAKVTICLSRQVSSPSAGERIPNL